MKKILFVILIIAFAVRIVGIGYGLPLWLVADEPPFVLGVLKMIELKTVIPRFHLEEFRSVLYYPPYISYFYLPFFSSMLAVKYLSFEGDRGSFINYLGADLSDFFMVARFLNVILAVFSVFLVYRVAKNIFKDEWIGLASAFFLGTSSLHILLSMTSRQWLAVSFIYILVLYFLTAPSLSLKKRYFLAVLTAGIGMGISAISAVALVLIKFYYLFFEKKKISELLREKFFYLLAAAILFLIVLPLWLYPASIGFQGKISIFDSKSLGGFLLSPFVFFKSLLFAEPVLMLFFTLGLIFVFFRNRKLFWTSLIFLSVYSFVFYFAFRFEDRFLTPILPMIAILAGFGFVQLFRRLPTGQAGWKFSVILLVLPLIFSLRLGYLAYQNDSRANLRNWIEKNIPEGSKVLVSARLMRLSSNAYAIREQEALDSGSLRQVDRSEAHFGKSPIYPSFHALNLYSMENKNFPFDKYASNYEYLVLPKLDYRKDAELHENFQQLGDMGSLVASFGEDADFSISESKLGKNPLRLLETKMLGPAVSLYRIK